MDGDNGLGPVVGAARWKRPLDWPRTAESDLSVCAVAIISVRPRFYVEEAIARDCIGWRISNAPPNMAAFGGRERFLGTNPMAVGIPAGKERPLIFDASSSVVARGKIIVAAQRGMPIPEGWAIDPGGRADHRSASGTRGRGAAVRRTEGLGHLVHHRYSVRGPDRASFALHLNTLENLHAVQNLGQVFAADRTDLVPASRGVRRRMDEILRCSRRAPGAAALPRVLAPGELEFDAEDRNRDRGFR